MFSSDIRNRAVCKGLEWEEVLGEASSASCMTVLLYPDTHITCIPYQSSHDCV